MLPHISQSVFTDQQNFNSPEIQNKDENVLAPFMVLASLITQKFKEVALHPDAFFNLSEPTSQYLSLPCARDDLESTESSLNFLYATKKEANAVHHERGVLLGRDPQSFGFRYYELKDRSSVILSFPNNALFNVLLKKLPSIFSFAIQSTYPAIGEVSEQIHVMKWIESGSWPYDGDADTLTRIKNTFHDAHHIIKSLQSDLILANTLHELKKRMKEKATDELFKNEGSLHFSRLLESLHNEGSDLKTKYFYIQDSHLVVHRFDYEDLSRIFKDLFNPSDFPLKLNESKECFMLRRELVHKMFPLKQSACTEID